MDAGELALRMHELTSWLDVQEEDTAERLSFDGAPFGHAYVTIDPSSSAPAASYNGNRIYLCGASGGLTRDGLRELLDKFDARGVRRRFVWLSPGPGLDSVRDWLRSLSFSQVVWTRYPTLVFEGSSHRAADTPFEIRRVSATDLARAVPDIGEAIMDGYSRTIGKPEFSHYLAYDRERPVAVAALAHFEEIGYLTYAGTAPAHRRRGAQSALIARRIADAQALGCTHIVSQTLTMLRDSWSNLQRAGFREVFEREVYEYTRD